MLGRVSKLVGAGLVPARLPTQGRAGTSPAPTSLAPVWPGVNCRIYRGIPIRSVRLRHSSDFWPVRESDTANRRID